MARDIYIGEILSNEEIQKDYFLMKVKLASSFDDPLAGSVCHDSHCRIE